MGVASLPTYVAFDTAPAVATFDIDGASRPSDAWAAPRPAAKPRHNAPSVMHNAKPLPNAPRPISICVAGTVLLTVALQGSTS